MDEATQERMQRTQITRLKNDIRRLAIVLNSCEKGTTKYTSLMDKLIKFKEDLAKLTKG